MKKTVIITGGNSGLGYEAATTLAQSSEWQVIIASRNLERTTQAAATITRATQNRVIPMQLDLGSFESVRQFVANFTDEALPPLHAIVCNAGLTSMQWNYTTEGIEQIFGVNHLGHFLLVNLLLPYLQDPGRIVMVSSGTHIPEHKLARITQVPVPHYVNAMALAYPEKAPAGEAPNSGFQSYSTSKLCNVLCAYELARRLEGRDISVFALDPGLMPDTMFVREFPAPVRAIFKNVFLGLGAVVNGIRSVKESGTHLARLVLDPELDGKTALYFDGLEAVQSSKDSYDVEKQRDLWDTSVQLTKLNETESFRVAV